MDQWFRPFSKFGTSALLSICIIFSGLLVSTLFYFIWKFGTISIAGIPLQLILITLIFPVLLAGVIFWLARRLELSSGRSENE